VGEDHDKSKDVTILEDMCKGTPFNLNELDKIIKICDPHFEYTTFSPSYIQRTYSRNEGFVLERENG